jgi:hypothetical protein
VIIDVKFAENSQHLATQFAETAEPLGVDFGEVQNVTEYVGGEKYDGDYIITPKIEEQMMPTKDKVLTDNVVVKSIPIYRVTNQTGGTTIYIAKEI